MRADCLTLTPSHNRRFLSSPLFSTKCWVGVCARVCVHQPDAPSSFSHSVFFLFFLHESVAMCSLIIQKTPRAFYKTRFVSCWTFRLMSKCVLWVSAACKHACMIVKWSRDDQRSRNHCRKDLVFYILFSATQERKRVESLCLKFFWCKGDASECSYQTGGLFCPPWRLMATVLPFL